MRCLVVWIIVNFLDCAAGYLDHEYYTQINGGRLQHQPEYFIAAPQLIRPAETLGIYVSIFKIRHTNTIVRASVSSGGFEYASVESIFTSPSTRLIQMLLPEYMDERNYTIRVWGTSSGSHGYLFFNETELIFQQKHITVFTQTDKPHYRRKDSIVKFRIIAVHQNLMPVKAGTITVYIKDGGGKIVKRFLNQQLHNGFFEDSVPIMHPRKYGWWTIETHGWGYIYEYKMYHKSIHQDKFEINATLPRYIFDNEYGLEGLLISNYTDSGYPVEGNASVTLTIKPPGQTEHFPVLKRTIPQFRGVTSFIFPMEHIKSAIGEDSLVGTQLEAEFLAYDWYAMEETYSSYKVYSQILSSDVKLIFVGGRVRTFKPLVPMPVIIAVRNVDGSRYDRSLYKLVHIQVIARRSRGGTQVHDLDQVIPDNSVINIQYVPHKDDDFIIVRASLSGLDAQFTEMTAYRHQTRSGQYLNVMSSSTNPTADTYMVFTVRATTYIPKIYYMIMSKANILIQDTLTMSATQKTFSLALSRDMVPEAKIIVYAMLGQGEILADSMQFHVKGLQTDKLKISINRGKDFSYKTIELNTFGEGSTFTAFSAAQYELYAQGMHSLFTPYMVEDELQTYEGNYNTSFKHKFYLDENKEDNVYFTAPSYAVDANLTFQYAGLVVFTDADLYRIEGSLNCNASMGFLSCFDGTCYLIEQHCDTVRQCIDGADEIGCEVAEDAVIRPDPMYGFQFSWITFDKTDWVWDKYYTQAHGRIDFIVDMPTRRRTWLISAFSLSTVNGLTFVKEPARLDSTRPFYMVLETDSRVRKGEQLGMQVNLYNFWHQDIETMVSLISSDAYRFIVVNDFGIVSSYSPRTLAGDVQTLVYLKKGEERLIHIPIVPTQTGKVTITVRAESAVGIYTLSKTVSVSMDGITNTYHTPFLIDLVNKGSSLIPDFWIPIPERFVVPNTREHLYVPGSQQATINVAGDVLGPVFSSSNPSSFNMYKMWEVVYNAAEQVTFDLSYNMLMLKYLKVSNQLKKNVLDTILGSINKYLQGSYAFIMSDGGVAYRRKNANSDIWMTSYYLDVLAQAAVPEWDNILFIDTNIINSLAMWLVNHQDKTGAFPPTTGFYDTKMRSNLTDDNGNLLHLPLSAYAVIGLASAVTRQVLSGVAQTKADTAMQRGADYLAGQFDRITDPFELCLVTHALHTANHNIKEHAFSEMRSKATIDQFVYWSPKPIPPNPSRIINTVPYQDPRTLPLPYSATAVQATAYALMVYLRNNWFDEAQPIMFWLQTQRETNSGFISSQDTVVAMQALVDYAARDTNRALYSMQVELQATATTDFNKKITLERGNFAQSFSEDIPVVYGSIRSYAHGTGMALIQLTSEVNVEYPWQIRRPEVRSFDLWIDHLDFHGRNLSLFSMSVCTRWIYTEYSEDSGSATLEVDIPTGFMVRKDILRKYQKAGRIPIMRYRYTKHAVTVSVDKIDTIGSCWRFAGERRWPVANTTIQHRVAIRSDFEPGLQNTTMYTTYGLFHLHICQVCGSFQCPYCAFYNTAPAGVPSSTVVLISVCLYAIVRLMSEQTNWL